MPLMNQIDTEILGSWKMPTYRKIFGRKLHQKADRDIGGETQASQSKSLAVKRIGRSRLRITCRRVTMSLRGWEIAVRLPICWLGWISNRWRSRLIETWHLLDWWYCHHWLWPKLAISFIHFNLVLGLH